MSKRNTSARGNRKRPNQKTRTRQRNAQQPPNPVYATLQQQIVTCQLCPRLIQHCREVAQKKRKAYLDCDYWGKPVANFGVAPAALLIVGLAPGAHGANRTGRMFTGDRSGDWLFRAMFRAGFATQAQSTGQYDGLELSNCVITSVCHCAPPDNQPTPGETRNCLPFLEQTIELTQPIVLLALGQLAWKSVVRHAIGKGWMVPPQSKFMHAAEVMLVGRDAAPKWLVGCFHPSQQNTFTGRLTAQMLDDVFRRIKTLLA